MLIARMATRRAKPNGQFLVRESEMSEFIKCEKISNLPGVGYHITDKLKRSVDLKNFSFFPVFMSFIVQ